MKIILKIDLKKIQKQTVVQSCTTFYEKVGIFLPKSIYHVAFMKKSSFNINHTMQIHPSVLGTKYVPTKY